MLGPTILRGGDLQAVARQSGSSFPSPGRAGQPRRRGMIRNHRSEIDIELEMFFEMTLINDHLAENIARVKEHEDRILGTRSVSRA